MNIDRLSAKQVSKLLGYLIGHEHYAALERRSGRTWRQVRRVEARSTVTVIVAEEATWSAAVWHAVNGSTGAASLLATMTGKAVAREPDGSPMLYPRDPGHLAPLLPLLLAPPGA